MRHRSYKSIHSYCRFSKGMVGQLRVSTVQRPFSILLGIHVQESSGDEEQDF
jgi:hypothetical protein